MMKFSIHSITSTQQQEFEDLAAVFAGASGYCWLRQDEIPTAIPKSLRNKLQSALLMVEKTKSGCIHIVCNGLRPDPKVNEIDQEPFGIVVYSSGASTSGMFIHHGDWEERSIEITPELRHILESTSLQEYFPLGEVTSGSSGPLSDLSRTSHARAFKAIVAVYAEVVTYDPTKKSYEIKKEENRIKYFPEAYPQLDQDGGKT